MMKRRRESRGRGVSRCTCRAADCVSITADVTPLSCCVWTCACYTVCLCVSVKLQEQDVATLWKL